MSWKRGLRDFFLHVRFATRQPYQSIVNVCTISESQELWFRVLVYQGGDESIRRHFGEDNSIRGVLCFQAQWILLMSGLLVYIQQLHGSCYLVSLAAKNFA